MILDETTHEYVSGGTLDTFAGGTINIVSIDGISIEGVVGQRENQTLGNPLGDSKVGAAGYSFNGLGDVIVLRNVDVRDHVSNHRRSDQCTCW